MELQVLKQASIFSTTINPEAILCIFYVSFYKTYFTLVTLDMIRVCSFVVFLYPQEHQHNVIPIFKSMIQLVSSDFFNDNHQDVIVTLAFFFYSVLL